MRRTLGVIVFVALGLVGAGTARADRGIRSARLEGGIGIRYGSFLIDGEDPGGVHPFHFDAGLRFDRWLFDLEYQLASVHLDADAAARGGATFGGARGLVHRAGANARWSFGRVGESDGGFDVWAELGLGVEHIRWNAGGAWTRPDLALGIGTSLLGWSAHEHGGLSVGLRVTLARRHDVTGAPATCAGPCDAPTPPTGWDHSFLFDATLLFGK